MSIAKFIQRLRRRTDLPGEKQVEKYVTEDISKEFRACCIKRLYRIQEIIHGFEYEDVSATYSSTTAYTTRRLNAPPFLHPEFLALLVDYPLDRFFGFWERMYGFQARFTHQFKEMSVLLPKDARKNFCGSAQGFYESEAKGARWLSLRMASYLEISLETNRLFLLDEPYCPNHIKKNRVEVDEFLPSKEKINFLYDEFHKLETEPDWGEDTVEEGSGDYFLTTTSPEEGETYIIMGENRLRYAAIRSI